MGGQGHHTTRPIKLVWRPYATLVTFSADVVGRAPGYVKNAACYGHAVSFRGLAVL